MQTAIIIVNYNDYDSTIRLIENIKKYQLIEKIVIVDNNSKEEEKEKLKSIKNKKVKILYNEENKGYSYALNVGAKFLISLYGKCNIIVSNSDIVIQEEKHLKELLKTLLQKKVGVAAPVVYENKTLNRGWRLTTPKQDIKMMLPKVYKYFEKKYRYYQEEHYKEKESLVEVVSGCFFFIKSTVLEEVGFFDENVFLYFEENILAKKLQKLGIETRVNNEVVIIHNHSVTVDKNINRKKKLRILRESELYYEEEYNNATEGQLKIMRAINKIVQSLMK